MSPITSQDQDMLNQQYQNLNGKERAELLLSSVFGMKMTEGDLEIIKTGLSEYIVWHNKQHPDSETCDHCGFVNDNIVMFKVIKYWHDHYQALKGNK